MSEAGEELPRKGRSNAILTYETVDEIRQGLVKVDVKLDRMDEKLGEQGRSHIDHEIRIRALELHAARADGGKGVAQWAGPFVVSLFMGLFALLNYFKP